MELNISENLNATKRDLDALNNYNNYNTIWNKINEINGYRRASGYESFEIMRDGISMEDRIEVQPKSSIFKDITSQYISKYKN